MDGGADYVLAVKRNQDTLSQAVIDHINEQFAEDLANAREHATRSPSVPPRIKAWRQLSAFRPTTKWSTRASRGEKASEQHVS